jgi:glyoxylase-like metal-dependent hydrolase (beta-lactamase superfamily II)
VTSPTNRRNFLAAAIGAAALSPKLFAQASSLAATKLADNYLLITGAGSNVLAIQTPDGIALVDGGDAAHTADLLKFVASQSNNRPLKLAFSTHWHWDHTGSNEAIRKAGAKIVSHENTKLWLGAEIDCTWQNRTYEPRPPEALPNETFYTSGKTTFGSQQIEYAVMPQAHTDGDIYVYFPGPNIVMTGDVVAGGTYPVLDFTTGGWITGMVNAQATLLKLVNKDTKIVPGSGAVMTLADLQFQHDTLATIRDRLLKLLKSGVTPKEMIAAQPTKEWDDKWGDPTQFIFNAYRGLWGHVRELGGIV